MRSYREEGKVKQEVLVHLGAYETPEAALSAWPFDIERLRAIGRDDQAASLERNLRKLKALMSEAEKKGERDG